MLINTRIVTVRSMTSINLAAAAAQQPLDLRHPKSEVFFLLYGARIHLLHAFGRSIYYAQAI